MAWRDQKSVRDQYVAWYDDDEASRYDSEPGHGMSLIEESALAADLREIIDLDAPLNVLDVGAGTGVLTKILADQPNLTVTAIEPSPAMLRRLTQKLPTVNPKEGFTDAPGDVSHFKPNTFDLVISRQVVCGLYDPLQAFTNWWTWLKPDGNVVVIDGLWEPWTGKWGTIAQKLPLSTVQTLALTPYLLEKSSFAIRHIGWPWRTNLCRSEEARKAASETATMRYVVVAQKLAEQGGEPAPPMTRDLKS